jgi:FtsX-like permease family/MacB-like periplasmic core domain
MNWHAEITAEFTRRHKRVDDAVVEEMAQHAAAAWEAARADGMSASEAETSVRALVSSWCEGTSGPRRIDRTPLLEATPASPSLFAGLALDLRLAARLLRRQPGFAFASTLMIALGIGATTSLFSLVNGVLLKPLPWRTAGRLIRVYDTTDRLASNNDPGAMTNVAYQVWRDQPHSIDGVAAWSTVFFLVPGDSGIDRVPAAMVTASLFPLLGASPILGSTFAEADERPDNTLVLSYGFWRERFGGATEVIGKLYAPMTQMTRGPVGLQYLTVRTTGDASALAADLRTIVRGVSSNGVVDQVMTMETRLMWSLARPRLYALLLGGFSTFALLIAVIGLFGGLSYGVTQRTREIGVRTALGATPRDIMRLVMVQGTAMTVAGLVIGFGVAAATVRYLAAFLFGVEPFDPTTFVTVGASLMVVAIVACAIPARRAARIDPILALKR